MFEKRLESKVEKDARHTVFVLQTWIIKMKNDKSRKSYIVKLFSRFFFLNFTEIDGDVHLNLNKYKIYKKKVQQNNILFSNISPIYCISMW